MDTNTNKAKVQFDEGATTRAIVQPVESKPKILQWIVSRFGVTYAQATQAVIVAIVLMFAVSLYLVISSTRSAPVELPEEPVDASL